MTKPERFDLIPVGPLTDLARHYGAGAHKHEPRGWEAGAPWSEVYAATLRHLTQFWAGTDHDTDPAMPEYHAKHVIAAAWRCLQLAEYMTTHPELDDRPHQQPAP